MPSASELARMEIEASDASAENVVGRAEALPPNPKQAYGDRKAAVHWVPPAAVIYMAQALGEGGRKYGPYNWRDLPVEAMTYLGGALRHLYAWMDGEDIDPDSVEGKSHLAGALASLAILVDAIESDTVIDNRPAPGGAPRLLLQGAAKGEHHE